MDRWTAFFPGRFELDLRRVRLTGGETAARSHRASRAASIRNIGFPGYIQGSDEWAFSTAMPEGRVKGLSAGTGVFTFAPVS